LKELIPGKIYRVQGLEGEADFEMSGRDMMEKGLLFDNLLEEESSLLKISSKHLPADQDR